MLLIHFQRIIARHKPKLDGRRLHLLDINARSIVRNNDFNLVRTLGNDGDADGCPQRFPAFFPLLRSLNAVIDAISYQVNERIFHFLQDSPIGFDLASNNGQFHVLTAIPAKIANKLGERFEQGGKWKHRHPFHIFHEIIHSPLECMAVVFEPFAQSSQFLFDGIQCIFISVQKGETYLL